MTEEKRDTIPTIRTIMEDPSASDWLRRTTREALRRDPVDAASEIGILAKVLDKRAGHVLARHPLLTMRHARRTAVTRCPREAE